MIYETAAILNLHGYCFDFDAPVLGTQEGLFDTPPPGVYSPSSSPTTVYTTQVVPVSTDPTKERYSRYILPQFVTSKAAACIPLIGGYVIEGQQ